MTPERWKRTEELYHAALALPVGDRMAYLAAACPDDQPMRRDVESLLNESQSGDGFLVEPPVDTAAPTVTNIALATMTERTLGGYRLQALLGVGGMGEVYRARDPTLGRDVAIKILPRAFTSHPERLARFEREARILASLNHPHICAIYGLNEADGQRFLVLELVDGDTLSRRLAARSQDGSRGSGLPLDEALTFAQQIAEALEAAHEQGVIHRDLKPANITITSGGVIKVVDFGLAKTIPAGDPASGSGDELTNADPTREGVVMGSAAYMSPEQACGRPVDRRTDIWAFGCVLYEMLTGRRPFTGATFSETLASVLKTDPEWSALPATVPSGLRRLLRRCLDKDPKRRLQAIGDARIQIEDLLAGVTDEAFAAPAPVRMRRSSIGPWIVGALACVVTALAIWTFKPLPPPAVVRLGFSLTSGLRLDASGGGHIVALSPDGTQMVFVGLPLRLYVRAIGNQDVRPIPGTEGYGTLSEPVFSPDGQSIAFVADSMIMRIAISGGSAMTICLAPSPLFGMNWGLDGIVFSLGRAGIWRVAPEHRATPKVFVRVDEDEVAQGPQVLPNGTDVLFTLATGDAAERWDTAQVVVHSLESGKRTRLQIAGSDARYVSTGHILYAVGGQLRAVAVDLSPPPMVTAGPVRILTEGVKRSTGSGAANVSVSSNGTLIYVPGSIAGSSAFTQIVLMDPLTGIPEVLNLPPRPYAFPRFSPDGTRIAFGIEDGNEATIWCYDLSGRTSMQPITSLGRNRFPTWISNSKVAFQSDREGDLAVFAQNADGTGDAERLTKLSRATHEPESWTGNTLIVRVTKTLDSSLWTLSLADKVLKPFSIQYASGVAFSTDGRYVSYSGSEGSLTTVYVQPFPPTGDRLMLPPARDGPRGAVWSPTGFFYTTQMSRFEFVEVTTNPFGFGKPVHVPVPIRLLGPRDSHMRTNYDRRQTDGKFIGLISAGGTEHNVGSDTDIQVVLGFFEDLKTRVRPR